MHRLLICRFLSVVLLAPALLKAQQPEPVSVNDNFSAPHRLGNYQGEAHFSTAEVDEALRSGAYTGPRNVPLSIVVDPEGRVESSECADPDDCPNPKELHSLAMSWTFRPWYLNGRPATVRLIEYAWVSGPEPLTNTVFPDRVDPSQVVISLSRRGNVTIFGDGKVLLRGSPKELPEGEHVSHISPEAFLALVDEFRKADFFTLQGEYDSGATDIFGFPLTLKIGAQTKQVFDRDGTRAGMPKAISDIEDQIDEIADTKDLIHPQPWIEVEFGGEVETAPVDPPSEIPLEPELTLPSFPVSPNHH